MKQYKILIAEDDRNLGEVLKEYLVLKGYAPVLARDGVEAMEWFMKEKFDLCVLDIMMPKKDGFAVASEIRAINSDMPFIFLTARSQQEDTLKGLKLGADDYIKKPFSMEELDLRLKAVLRRAKNHQEHKEVFQLGKYNFDHTRQELSINGEVRKLTSKESELLFLLAQTANKTLDRSAALKIIWGDDSYFNARSMDVYITKLRKHLKDDPRISIITVHGQGFRLVID